MRELMLGPRRFTELRQSLPGLSAKTLTERLAGLEASGIVVRDRLPAPANASVYRLTPWGEEAREVIGALGRWAARSPRHDPSLPLSPVSIMLSFENMLVPERAAGLDLRIGFRLRGEEFVASVADGRLAVTRGPLDRVEAVVATGPEALAAATYGDVPLPADAIAGDAARVARFLGLFSLPPKA